MITHVILNPGTDSEARFQHEWKDGTKDAKILSELNRNKRIFGYNGVVVGIDETTGMNFVNREHPATGFAYDHPETVVVIGEDDNGEFKEIRRIKGPAKGELAPNTPSTVS